MGNGLIFAAIAGIGITLFIGAGGLKKIEDLIPKDLKEKASDKANEATNTPTEKKENDVIPESPKKKLTKELEQKLPNVDDKEKLKQANQFENKSALTTLNEQKTAHLSPQDQKNARYAREIVIDNDVKYSTSLAGSVAVTGPQFKRNTETAKQIQKKEAERAQTISTLLYGNVQNAKFVKDADKITKPANTTTKAKSAKESNAERLKAALEFNKKVLEAKSK